MPHLLNRINILAVKIYKNTENSVIGNALRITIDSRERCKTLLLFDYIFFHILFLVPKTLISLYIQNTTDLVLIPALLLLLLTCMLMVKNGVSVKATSVTVAFVTLVIPVLSSFYNNQDTSPKYAMAWLLSILFCYIATNITVTLSLGALLCGYLSLVAWMKINHITVYISTGYTPEQNLLFSPVMTALYILFMIRVLGAHYRNIFIYEQEKTLQKQRQHSSLLNQHLTKQFIILKGLSRSGKSKYLDGNKELLEACLGEIEKQCESAIDYLDNGHHVDSNARAEH
ncbi:hypothetical protein [Chitinophaga tropicalis]|uniref:Uncharacterized protein n=1 Tax=Chitinophaga tropicalis TaxID=2683588 RepID=A0A7K1U7T7_9BACT|nr:hypothetical protein [Chitinophaga tropicalis]MVT10427.1 hypothetical protein [Chitinophaga tropicalis]